MIETTARPDNGRGCGDREPDNPYVCCGTSPFGKPLEEFIVDPARPWPGKFQRGVKILPRNPKDPDSVNDLVIFVGSSYYASPWDFVEEVRRFGASRKVNKDLPFEQLTPGNSRMVFVHSKAIPDFEYHLDGRAPLAGCKAFRWEDEELWRTTPTGWHPSVDEPPNTIPCTFGLRDLSFFIHFEDAILAKGQFTIEMPSFSYTGKTPVHPNWAKEEFDPEKDTKWQIGIFMALPLTHVEWKDHADPEVEERVKNSGFESVTLDW